MQNQQEDEVEKLLRDYQMAQEQLRALAMQLDQFQAQKSELDRAKQEIDKASGKIYSNVAGIIIETDKAKALTDIKDRSELIELRISSVTKQYNDFKGKEKLLGDKLTQMYNSRKSVSQ